jgi:hypothetical protein
MARTQVFKSSLSNSNKATNAYGGIREEKQGGETQRTPRFGFKGFLT